MVRIAALGALSADEYRSVLESASQAGWVGGVIYDALIAKVADAAGVDRLITLNVSDFQRVWPAGTARIASPQTLPPPGTTTDGGPGTEDDQIQGESN